MSVLVHGEEKRESVVRELHGVGLEHREARAVGHDDVVGAPCARALSLCESRYRVDGVEGETPRARVRERDRVAQRRVGVAVAVRRPHAAAARPRSRGPGYIAATLATRGRTRSAPSSFFAPSLSRRLRDSARHVFGVRGWRATPRVAFVLSRALWPSRASRRDFGSQGSRSGVRPSSGGGRVCFL